MAPRLPLLAALGTVGALAVALVVVLAATGVRTTGSNNEFDRGAAPAVAAGATVCQPHETVPAGTGAVRVTAQSSPSALAVEVRRDGRAIARGPEVAWTGGTGPVALPLRRELAHEQDGASVCIRVGGPAPVGFFGYPRDPALAASVGERGTGHRIRLTYVRGGEESWAASAGRVADRLGTARGELLDGWPAYGAIAAALALLGVVLVVVRRELAA